MKTVKLKIMNEIDVNYELRVYNSILHYAYNRIHDDNSLKEKEVRALCNNLFKGKINSWILQCAVKESLALQKRNKSKKVIFGGKSLLVKYLKKNISKEEYKEIKTIPISIQGETLQKGNRLFDFDFSNNLLTFKPNKSKHIEIKLGNLHRNLKRELCKIGELCLLNQTAVSIKLNNKFIWITYDETSLGNSLKLKDLRLNRCIGLDLNPNYIGLSVLEFKDNDEFKVLYKQVFDLQKLTDKKCSTEKRKYELIKICYLIKRLMNCWKCSKLMIEDLNIKSSNKGLGKTFNRLCNNVWNRSLVVNKLKMLSTVYGFDLIEVNPAYSSFVGNFTQGNLHTPDMVAASIEIARRGYKKYDKGWFYPRFNIDNLDEQWKQTLVGVKSWKEAFLKLKNSKVKYRVQLSDCITNAVFSSYNRKSKIQLYCF